MGSCDLARADVGDQDAVSSVRVRPYEPATDERWAEGVLGREFGGRWQARRGELLDVLALPGFVAEGGGERVGLLTYRVEGDECELAVLIALRARAGVGSTLVDALVTAVGHLTRIWVVTTNDNLDALRFYQRRGFTLSALRPRAVDIARDTLKPSISPVGKYGIPLRDELELELRPQRRTG